MSINDVLNFKFEVVHFLAIPILCLGVACVFFIFELVAKGFLTLIDWLNKTRKEML